MNSFAAQIYTESPSFSAFIFKMLLIFSIFYAIISNHLIKKREGIIIEYVI